MVLLGHGIFLLQGTFTSEAGPRFWAIQDNPPLLGGGLLHCRVLLKTPVGPQVEVH